MKFQDQTYIREQILTLTKDQVTTVQVPSDENFDFGSSQFLIRKYFERRLANESSPGRLELLKKSSFVQAKESPNGIMELEQTQPVLHQNATLRNSQIDLGHSKNSSSVSLNQSTNRNSLLRKSNYQFHIKDQFTPSPQLPGPLEALHKTTSSFGATEESRELSEKHDSATANDLKKSRNIQHIKLSQNLIEFISARNVEPEILKYVEYTLSQLCSELLLNQNERSLAKHFSPPIQEFHGEIQQADEMKMHAKNAVVYSKERQSKLNLISRTSINDIQVEELEHVFSASPSPFNEHQFVSPGLGQNKITAYKSQTQESLKSQPSESQDSRDSESNPDQSGSESENDTVKKRILKKGSRLRQSSVHLEDSKETDRSSRSEILVSSSLRIQNTKLEEAHQTPQQKNQEMKPDTLNLSQKDQDIPPILTKIRIDSFPAQSSLSNHVSKTNPTEKYVSKRDGNTEGVLNINIHQPMMSVNLNAYPGLQKSYLPLKPGSPPQIQLNQGRTGRTEPRRLHSTQVDLTSTSQVIFWLLTIQNNYWNSGQQQTSAEGGQTQSTSFSFYFMSSPQSNFPN